MRFVALAIVATLTFSASARAQTYTVNIDGSGDFTDLQVALDTVPAGSTLLLYADGGPVAGNVVIRQSVTIVGHGNPWIAGNANGASLEDFLPAILVAAASDSVVVLEGLTVIPVQGDIGPTIGIEVDGVGTLVVDRCSVQGVGAQLGVPMPIGWSPPSAIAVTGSANIVALFNSSLIGGTGTYEENIGDWGGCAGDGTIIGGPGGIALDATKAALALVRASTLIGGTGGDANWSTQFGCGDNPPDVLEGGVGGDAIAGSAYVSNCTLTPGKGGTTTGSDLGVVGSDGAEVSGSRHDLPNNIAVSGPATIGSPLTLSGSSFGPFRVALLFLSTSLAPPFHIRQGDWFLAPPVFYLGFATTDVNGAFSLTATLPNDPSLVGVTLALQFADADHLSEPIALVFTDQ